MYRGPGTTRACTHRVQKLRVYKDLTMRPSEYGATADFFTSPHWQVNEWQLIVCWRGKRREQKGCLWSCWHLTYLFWRGGRWTWWQIIRHITGTGTWWATHQRGWHLPTICFNFIIICKQLADVINPNCDGLPPMKAKYTANTLPASQTIMKRWEMGKDYYYKIKDILFHKYFIWLISPAIILSTCYHSFPFLYYSLSILINQFLHC